MLEKFTSKNNIEDIILDYFKIDKTFFKVQSINANFTSFHFSNRLKNDFCYDTSINIFVNGNSLIAYSIYVSKEFPEYDDYQIHIIEKNLIQSFIKSLSFKYSNFEKHFDRFSVTVRDALDPAYIGNIDNINYDEIRNAKIDVSYVTHLKDSNNDDIKYLYNRLLKILFNEFCLSRYQYEMKDEDYEFFYRYFHNDILFYESDYKFVLQFDDKILNYIHFDENGNLSDTSKDIIKIDFKI